MAENNENEKTEYPSLSEMIDPLKVNDHAKNIYDGKIGYIVVLGYDEYAIFPVGITYLKRNDSGKSSDNGKPYVSALFPKNLGTSDNPQTTKRYLEESMPKGFGEETSEVETIKDVIDKILGKSSVIGHIDLRKKVNDPMKLVS